MMFLIEMYHICLFFRLWFSGFRNGRSEFPCKCNVSQFVYVCPPHTSFLFVYLQKLFLVDGNSHIHMINSRWVLRVWKLNITNGYLGNKKIENHAKVGRIYIIPSTLKILNGYVPPQNKYLDQIK